MAKVTKLFSNFTSGELSPRLRGRSDIDHYENGCATLTNFTVWTQGGANKRPGTKYISTVKDSTKYTRLVSYVFSADDAYILEFGDKYIRFYKNGGVITTVGTTPYEIVTVFGESQLRDLKFVQSADVVFITHPDVPPQKLTRYDDADWTIEEVNIVNGPFMDDNTDIDYFIKPSDYTGSISLTASGCAPFTEYHVGALWGFKGTRKIETDITAENKYSNEISMGSDDTCIIDIGGTWVGTVTLQRTTDAGDNWVDYYNYTSNIVTTVIEYEDDVYYRIGVKTGNFTSGTVETKIGKQNQVGYVKITDYVSSTVVSGTVIEDLPIKDYTYNWMEGSWSDYNGYPSCVAFYEERLILASTGYQPQTIWGSVSDDYENFDEGVGASDAYEFTLASSNINTIVWMVNTFEVLHIGTIGSEWKFGSKDTPTTPTNVRTNRETSYGSEAIQPVSVGQSILFIQSGGKKLRQRHYNYEADAWISADITVLSEHLFVNNYIYDICYTDNPDPTVWLVRDDGVLVGISYDLQRELIAFHKHTTTGEFDSIASIPGTDKDELWCIAKRTVGGETKRFVEQFQTTSWEDIEDGWYVDSGLDYSGVAKDTFSGIEHLEGVSVTPVVGGAILPDQTVISGTLTFDNEYTQVTAGLSYSAVLETMPIEVLSTAGTAQTKKKTVKRVSILLYKTLGLDVGGDEDNVDVLPFRSSADLMGSAPELFTGDKQIEVPIGFNNNVSIAIVSSQPTPCSIIGVIPDVVISKG